MYLSHLHGWLVLLNAVDQVCVSTVPQRERKLLKKPCLIASHKKTQQINWVVKIWSEWARARNAKLLSSEKSFSSNSCSLFLFKLNFWISRFVLEIHKKDGEPYPPNTLNQIICSFQCNLRETDRADGNLFMNTALHDFCSALDGEMKWLNAIGNYVSKQQAQPVTVEQANRLWEMGFLTQMCF